MEFKNASNDDFSTAFEFIKQLWDYNTYEMNSTRTIYKKIINDENSVVFFLKDNGEYKGFCHCCFFDTLWMTGLTCYVSGLITNSDDRNKGYGTKMMDHVIEIAKAKNCKAIILDSGMPRKSAHTFYENYGFEKSCYGFELVL